MRTFYFSLAVFIGLVVWLLNKPIPQPPQVARAFTEAEINYLEKSFDYAMDNLHDGEHYDWSAAGVNGRISAGTPYKSKLKADCRYYVEIARTSSAQKTESGVACRRQSTTAGWCRLNPKEPQSCALEKMESLFAKQSRYAILQGTQAIDALLATQVNVSTDGLAPPTPTIPGINVTLPEVHMEVPEVSRRNFLPLPWEPAPKK